MSQMQSLFLKPPELDATAAASPGKWWFAADAEISVPNSTLDSKQGVKEDSNELLDEAEVSNTLYNCSFVRRLQNVLWI